jgi:hypothetical protein
VLSGISCQSASACQAVGGDVNRAGGGEAVVETLRGSAWTATTPPLPARINDSDLSAVSCPSAALCQAVGSYTKVSEADKPLDETWRGAGWSESSWRDLPGPPDATVTGVACTAQSCLAAGDYIGPRGGYQALAELRQGSRWTLSTLPAPPNGTSPQLAAISCGAPDACVAVGTVNSTGPVGYPLPLAEAWNGTRWTAVTTPLPAPADQGGLYAVSCDGTSYCQAVGYYITTIGAVTRPLAETWNGTRWTAATPPPPPGGKHLTLYGVSCPVASSCMAVGQYTAPPGVGAPLAEELRGGRWTPGSPPVPAKAHKEAYLDAVSCVSVSVCEAVGEHGGIRGHPLAEAWQSGTWAAQTPPVPARALLPRLTGISCRASGCLAVGQYGVAGDWATPNRPLADSLQGQTWTLSRVPLPRRAGGSILSAVACGTADCVSVGTDTVPTGAAYPIVATHP